MNETIQAVGKLISVEKAVNIAFVTLLTLSLTAIQQKNEIMVKYFSRYFIFFFILYFLVPVIRAFHTWFRKKLGIEEENVSQSKE